MTLMCNSGVKLLGEIRCQSLLGVKGLKLPSRSTCVIDNWFHNLGSTVGDLESS